LPKSWSRKRKERAIVPKRRLQRTTDIEAFANELHRNIDGRFPDLTSEQRQFIRGLLLHDLRASTRLVYARHAFKFVTWCHQRGLDPREATLAMVLVWLGVVKKQGGNGPESILSHRKGVRYYLLVTTGRDIADDPKDKIARKGILGRSKLKQRKPATLDEVRALVMVSLDPLRDARDRAIILMMFFGCMPPTLLGECLWEFIQYSRKEMKVAHDHPNYAQFLIRANPDDPVMCPVRALIRWRELGGRSEGYIFSRIDRYLNHFDAPLRHTGVGDILRRRCEAAGVRHLSPRDLIAGRRTLLGQEGHGDIDFAKVANFKHARTGRHFNLTASVSGGGRGRRRRRTRRDQDD
jgi:hypothetical protein